MGNGLQTASAVVQLTGGNVFGLISAIVSASQRASQNKKICRELAVQVQQIGDLLRRLQEQPGMSVMELPETSAPLMDLRETLERACVVVESCSRGGYVRGLGAGGSRATRLRDVQRRIQFFLQLFPMISYLDSTRLLLRFIDSAAEAQGDLTYPIDTHDEDRLQKLSFYQLVDATNNIPFENQIEQGPYSTLYKGQLHGNDVTIRKLTISSSKLQLPPSMSPYELFKNEVKILPKLQHKNIVKLIKFCAERSERILVYEYMQNGSLEDVIFGRMRSESTVEWPTRFRLIEGVAQGAVYIDNHSRLRIIHRDLRPGNILLDSEMNPRICTFDSAKILCPGMDKGSAECVAVHSIGYIAPECIKEHTFSVKTDVYSFGVMVLEIISGQRWTQSFQENYYRDLRTWAFKGSLRYGAKLVQKLKNFVDPSLHKISFLSRSLPRCLSFPARRIALSQLKEIRRCVQVALLCIQKKPERRPDMVAVVRLLSPGKAKVPFPRRPGYAESPL